MDIVVNIIRIKEKYIDVVTRYLKREYGTKMLGAITTCNSRNGGYVLIIVPCSEELLEIEPRQATTADLFTIEHYRTQ